MKILSFSGGRTSAYMLANYDFDLAIFCNTGKEAEGTLDFVRKCGEYFEKDIIWLEYTTDTKDKFKIVNFNTASRNGEPFEQLIKKSKFIPNEFTRTCTLELKIKTIHRYLKNLKIDLESVDMMLGIRKDEPKRYFKLKDSNRNKWENIMPLYKDNISEKDIKEFWKNQPFDLNINTHLGNCDLCFHKKISKKTKILKENPNIAEWWIEMENLIGATFNQNYSIKDLLNMSQSQLSLFDNDIECFCNID
jgi:3'-phosphoadenosine 5'-phosphosulfate sulfotransferase (PAPS reductase)/FAD synthetase